MRECKLLLCVFIFTFLAACGEQIQGQELSTELSEQGSTTTTDVQEEQQINSDDNLQQIREEALNAGAICALSCIGGGSDTSDILLTLKKDGLLERYPFLESAPILVTPGDEWFVVIPVDPFAQIQVYGTHLDTKFNRIEDGLVYDSQPGNGIPLIVICNLGDFGTYAVDIIVTDSTGNTVSFSPAISLKDGRIYTQENVYVFPEEWRGIEDE